MISPLQLEEHHLLEASIRTNPHWDAAVDEAAFNAILQVRGETLGVVGEKEVPYLRISAGTYFGEGEQQDGRLAAQTVLELDINADDEDEGKTPYNLRVVVYGRFSAHNFPAEGEEKRTHALRVVRANSAALLYGVARQVVSELTLQSPYRSLVLPSLRFQEVVEHELRLEQASDEEDAGDDRTLPSAGA